MKQILTTLLLSLAALASPPMMAQAAIPQGSELQINTVTTDAQRKADVAVAPGGDFVVVWTTYDDLGYLSTIKGQRVTSAGGFVGAEFEAGTSSSAKFSASPAVGVGDGGDFVVVWERIYLGSTQGLQGQRFDSSGTELGSLLEIDFPSAGFVDIRPDVAFVPSGDFLVVWSGNTSTETDTSGQSIQGQRFASDGSLSGTEFQINTYTTFDQLDPSIGSDSQGGFVVSWLSAGNVQGQRFASDGTAVGDEFQINTYTTGIAGSPSLVVHPNGDFVVVWDNAGSGGNDNSYRSIHAQRFAADGVKVGNELQVNTYTTAQQARPVVVGGAGGSFAVAWESNGSSGSDSSSQSVQAQRFSSSGAFVGDELQVNTFTTGFQLRSAIAGDAEGTFLVVWDSDGSGGDDDSSTSIQGQRLLGAIFSDGFESGDTSAWSFTSQ